MTAARDLGTGNGPDQAKQNPEDGEVAKLEFSTSRQFTSWLGEMELDAVALDFYGSPEDLLAVKFKKFLERGVGLSLPAGQESYRKATKCRERHKEN